MAADDTGERILKTASTHFATHGFEGASLRRIADDAGIKAATIFHYYPGGKAGLFEAIFADIAETIRIRIIDRYGADTGLAPLEAIVQMTATFWDYCADHSDYAKLILLRGSGADRNFASLLEGHARAIVVVSRKFIEDAQKRGELADFDVEHFMLWSCVHPLTVLGAPFFSGFLMPVNHTKRLRTRYLEMVRNFVTPREAATDDAPTAKAARPKKLAAKTDAAKKAAAPKKTAAPRTAR